MSLEIKYGKLRGRIVEKYGTIAEFAKALGVSRTTCHNKLAGRTSFSAEDIVRWAKLLDISIAEYGIYFFA